LKKNEIDVKRRIIDESYYDDETDIEGIENVLLTENEQNKGDDVQKSIQMQIMEPKKKDEAISLYNFFRWK
jgi:hypothetical protein